MNQLKSRKYNPSDKHCFYSYIISVRKESISKQDKSNSFTDSCQDTQGHSSSQCFCFSLDLDVSIREVSTRGARDQFDEIQEKKKVHPSLDSVDDDGNHRMERRAGIESLLRLLLEENFFPRKKERNPVSSSFAFCFKCSTSFSSS